MEKHHIVLFLGILVLVLTKIEGRPSSKSSEEIDKLSLFEKNGLLSQIGDAVEAGVNSAEKNIGNGIKMVHKVLKEIVDQIESDIENGANLVVKVVHDVGEEVLKSSEEHSGENSDESKQEVPSKNVRVKLTIGETGQAGETAKPTQQETTTSLPKTTESEQTPGPVPPSAIRIKYIIGPDGKAKLQ
ncbi:uncharacterized protein LOC123676287 isoform X2 [Harmonia axyridis]|uniref:uncharacterized protein LOC123676287 isoform X2 n=1 Tax=Harmonia axyridis TaxID=115357 RepID=UPI001E276500|nr:uncharacterized protein LOC123676287 isoform X2 [Harmonia axyridis]